MRELQAGLWHWQAPHQDWEPSELWSKNVSSYAIDDGERLLLFDPLAVPTDLGDLAASRETAIVLTAPWHERDAQSLVERLGVPVYTPLPDTAEDLMRMYGITAEQAGDGSPDVVWLLKEGIGEAHPYAAGDRLDVGVEAAARAAGRARARDARQADRPGRARARAQGRVRKSRFSVRRCGSHSTRLAPAKRR